MTREAAAPHQGSSTRRAAIVVSSAGAEKSARSCGEQSRDVRGRRRPGREAAGRTTAVPLASEAFLSVDRVHEFLKLWS